jgi:hypothetical protein
LDSGISQMTSNSGQISGFLNTQKMFSVQRVYPRLNELRFFVGDDDLAGGQYESPHQRRPDHNLSYTEAFG